MVPKVNRPVSTVSGIYRQLARLHDLWIVLAWAGLLTGIMLNTFYHRGCSSFTQGDPGDPCLSFIDLVFIFAVAVGAGLAMADERIAIIGFVISLGIAVFFFLVALAVAPFLGLQDPIIQDRFLNQSFLIAFRYVFPFPLMVSLFGVVTGLYLEGKYRISEV